MTEHEAACTCNVYTSPCPLHWTPADGWTLRIEQALAVRAKMARERRPLDEIDREWQRLAGFGR